MRIQRSNLSIRAIVDEIKTEHPEISDDTFDRLTESVNLHGMTIEEIALAMNIEIFD